MDIVNFHVKHNYYVSIEPIKNFCGCSVIFPKNKLMNIPELNKTYILYSTNYTIEYYVQLKLKDTIQAHNNNIKLLVVQDILLTTLRRNMSRHLLLSKEKRLFELLEFEQTKTQKAEEAKLCKEFSNILSGQATGSNIEGYDQLLSYFEKGGFLP